MLGTWSLTLGGRAILTMFQIQDAQSDPLTRMAALCSLVSAQRSLSLGNMYIVRFDNMRIMYRASRWAEVCPNSSLVNSHSCFDVSCIRSLEDRNGHILEFLGPARTSRRMARVVCALLHYCNHVLRLEHRRWRDTLVSLATGGARPAGRDHVPSSSGSGVLRTCHPHVPELRRGRTKARIVQRLYVQI